MRIKDGDWILVDYDPKSGRQVWMRENGDGTTTYRTDYPCDPIVEANTAQRNMAQPGWKGDYHHIASLSAGAAWGDFMTAFNQDDHKYVSKWLNDSDNRAWRTKDGTV